MVFSGPRNDMEFGELNGIKSVGSIDLPDTIRSSSSMGSSSYSANRHRDSTRLFLSFNPHNVRTIRQASRFFLSLVAFVQEGNELDDVVIYKACLSTSTPTRRHRHYHVILNAPLERGQILPGYGTDGTVRAVVVGGRNLIQLFGSEEDRFELNWRKKGFPTRSSCTCDI
ncbi:hypothetical protein BLNAU_25231 [Blattamonas nauphoetae]|uniref:Uncharacterized protein n=1 Tax=Blattamonas nauphoetae TaxID=2049346 RepID=A0ABQ9WK71_9EUKA|nr:hypothetical protein BLNAU_25231 [Blattamonas nauphoetae]